MCYRSSSSVNSQAPAPKRVINHEHEHALSAITEEAPNSVTNEDGSVNYGIYRGRISNANVVPGNLPFPFWGPLSQLRHKKWQFHALDTDELYLTMAVLQAGYVTKAVCLLYIKKQGAAYALDGTAPLSFGLASFGGSSIDSTIPIVYQYGNNTLSFSYVENSHWMIQGSLLLTNLKEMGKSLRCDFDLSLTDAHGSRDQLSLVFPFTNFSPAYTHKAMCLDTSGTLSLGNTDNRYSLNGQRGSLDWTSVYAPYLTRWRWLFVSGLTQDGKRFGLNLSSDDHYDDKENALWIDGTLILTGGVSFTLPTDDLLADPNDLTSWTVASTHHTSPVQIRVTFHPEFKKFVPMSTGIVDSKYLQLLGTMAGEITAEGITHRITGAFGTAERQLCLW